MNQAKNQEGEPTPEEEETVSGIGRRTALLKRAFKALTVKDALAGLTLSIPSIPDSMASAVLAGVNPIHGLYSLMIGTPIGAIFTGSVFMNVVSTGAMSIAVNGGIADYQGEELISALVTVTIIIGIVQVAAGLLRLGFLTRFVSNSVMTGFISGIAVLIILSQTGTLTGYESEYSNKVAKTFDLLVHINEISLPTTLLGTASVLLISLLGRSFLGKYSMLITVVIAIALIMIFEPASIETVADIGDIPSGLPRPYLPIPLFDFGLVASGFAVAIIGLLQGAGISSEYPNPDGKYPSISRDFFGQGIANIAVGLFRGIPVGGSMSATVMIVAAGARTRWANILTGIFAIVAVFFLKDFIVKLPMTVLAAILIVAGFQAINLNRVRTVWETGLTQRLVMLLTFGAVLVLPIAYAVLLGVAIHFILHIFRSAAGVKIVQLEPQENGTLRESAAPDRLPTGKVIVLFPVGDLFFAGAGYLNKLLPQAEGATGTIAIMRLRRHKEVGSTFLQVIARYAEELKKNRNKLVLAGVSTQVYRQLKNTGLLEKLGKENVYSSTEIITESLQRAINDANQWISPSPRGEDNHAEDDH